MENENSVSKVYLNRLWGSPLQNAKKALSKKLFQHKHIYWYSPQSLINNRFCLCRIYPGEKKQNKKNNKTRGFFLLHSKHTIREMKCEVLEAWLHFTPLTQPKLQLTVTGIVPEQRLKNNTSSSVRDITQNSHSCKSHFRATAVHAVFYTMGWELSS